MLLLQKIDGLSAGEVSKSMFIQFINTNPSVMLPAFHMQRAMQKRMGGDDFWHRLAKGRTELMSGSASSMTHDTNSADDAETSFMSLQRVLAERREGDPHASERSAKVANLQFRAMGRLNQPGYDDGTHNNAHGVGAHVRLKSRGTHVGAEKQAGFQPVVFGMMWQTRSASSFHHWEVTVTSVRRRASTRSRCAAPRRTATTRTVTRSRPSSSSASTAKGKPNVQGKG